MTRPGISSRPHGSRACGKRQDRGDACAGFTLIEVLVAFAVLAMFMAGIQQLLVSAAGNARRSAERLGAESVARTLMTGPMAIGVASSLSGRMNGYNWRIAYDRMPDSLPTTRPDGIEPPWLPLQMTVTVWSPNTPDNSVSVDVVRLLKVDAQ